MTRLDPDTDSCNAVNQSRQSEQEAAEATNRSGRSKPLGNAGRLTTAAAGREVSQ